MSHGGLGAHYRHNATAATAARSGEPLRPLSNVTAAYSCERRSAIVQVYRLKSLCDCLQSLYHDVAKFRAGCKGKRSVIAANFVCERSRVSSAIARYVAARKTAAARAHPRAPLSLPPFGRCFLQLTRCALEKQARRPTPTLRDSHVAVALPEAMAATGRSALDGYSAYGSGGGADTFRGASGIGGAAGKGDDDETLRTVSAVCCAT